MRAEWMVIRGAFKVDHTRTRLRDSGVDDAKDRIAGSQAQTNVACGKVGQR